MLRICILYIAIVYIRISKPVKGTLNEINSYIVLKLQLFIIKKEFKYIYVTVSYNSKKSVRKIQSFVLILVIFIMKTSI